MRISKGNRKGFLTCCLEWRKSAFLSRAKANLASQNTEKTPFKETQRKDSRNAFSSFEARNFASWAYVTFVFFCNLINIPKFLFLCFEILYVSTFCSILFMLFLSLCFAFLCSKHAILWCTVLDVLYNSQSLIYLGPFGPTSCTLFLV